MNPNCFGHFLRYLSVLLKALFPSLALFLACACNPPQSKVPVEGWRAAAPSATGLDAAKLAALDADITAGKYGLVDSMLVIRCGKEAYEKSYQHDYHQIYGESAKKQGPLNHDINGQYNYFNSDLHPYYLHSDLHTMQSVTKTVTSVTIGVALERGEFPVDVDAPILKFFDESKIQNLDDRKRRITLRNLLTMTAGLQWNESLPYDHPENSADVMESKTDWAQYVIDQPMASEPGKVFVYNSGVSQLLSYIFQKVTGKNVDEYAAEYLFKPLGIIHYYWKHSPTGLADTEGGLYLSAPDLAKIGYLYLKDGKWERKQIVPLAWIKQSLTPQAATALNGPKYGFQWWLVPYASSPDKLAWAAHGFGGQQLVVVPEDSLIVVFTGWDILPKPVPRPSDEVERVIAAVDTQYRCPASDD